MASRMKSFTTHVCMIDENQGLISLTTDNLFFENDFSVKY